MHDVKEYNKWLRDEIMDAEDEKKEQLLRFIAPNFQDSIALYDQVHIPVGYDIFDFSFLD